MKKYLIIILFACCLPSSYCFTQGFEDPQPPIPSNPRPGKRPIKPVSLPVSVQFVSNADYYLTIDGKKYGKISKDNPKTVRLATGTRKLFLESAETGEVLKPFLNVTRDMGKNGAYTFRVTFKKDTVATGSPVPNDSLQNRNLGSPKTDRSSGQNVKADSSAAKENREAGTTSKELAVGQKPLLIGNGSKISTKIFFH